MWKRLFEEELRDYTNYILSIKPIGIFALNMNGNDLETVVEIIISSPISSSCISDFQVS